MKKELVTHFTFFVAYFSLASLFQGWFKIDYVLLWLGGILGTFLPDLDHLIYVYFLRPKEATSQKAVSLIGEGEVKKSLEFLTETSDKREKLIFHTVFFQILFLGLTYLVITSSGSIFGRGLVMAFSLSLFIDQVIEIMQTGSISSWFTQTSINLSKEQQRWYLIVILVVLLFFGFLL